MWALGALFALGCTAGNPDFSVRAEGGARWDGAADTADAGVRADGAARAEVEDGFVAAGVDAGRKDDAEPAADVAEPDTTVGAEVIAEVTAEAPEMDMAASEMDMAVSVMAVAPELPPVDLAPPPPMGLLGEYYDGRDFGRLIFTRVDPTIDFDWGSAAADPRLPADRFSVRWTGTVIPRYSERTTFFTSSDDGVRLWLDGVLVIDRWANQPLTEHTASIALVAGRPVRLRLEYYDNTLSASARLSWASSSQSKEIVPAAQLTP